MQDIVIKADYIKKGLYVAIILILIGVIIFQYNSKGCFKLASLNCPKCEECPVCPNVTQSAVQSIAIEPEEPPSATKNKTEEVEKTPVNLAGTLSFVIDSVTYIKSNASASTEYGKIATIKYTIDNQLKDITPKLVFCGIVDSATESDDLNQKCDASDDKYRATMLPTIKGGKKVTLTTDLTKADIILGFSNFNLEKTITVVLKDSDGTTLKNATKKFTIE